MKKMSQWGNVRMTQSLIDEIAEYVQTEGAKKQGYTNVTQFVNSTIRKRLDEIQKQGYHIILRNKQSDTYLDLVIRENGKNVFCKECNSEDCMHVEMALEDKGIRKILKKNGFSLSKSWQKRRITNT